MRAKQTRRRVAAGFAMQLRAASAKSSGRPGIAREAGGLNKQIRGKDFGSVVPLFTTPSVSSFMLADPSSGLTISEISKSVPELLILKKVPELSLKTLFSALTAKIPKEWLLKGKAFLNILDPA